MFPRYLVDLSASEDILANYTSEELSTLQIKRIQIPFEFYFNNYLVKFNYDFIV